MSTNSRRAMLPATALAATLILAACGGSPVVHYSATLTAPAASPSTPDCQTQVNTWGSNGGNAELHAVAHDTSQISKDIPAAVAALESGSTGSAFTALGNDGSQLNADAQAALSDPPPTCRAGSSHWFRLAMAEYSSAGQDLVTAASQVQGGNVQGATTAVVASNKALTKGTRALGKATAVNATGS